MLTLNQNTTEQQAEPAVLSPSPDRTHTWRSIIDIALQHRRALILAHVIAVLGTLASVPAPLLMPLLIDEVLLGHPGVVVHTINRLFPDAWHGPVLYVLCIAGFTMLLRTSALLLGAWQLRQFTVIAKDVTFHLRRDLLARLQRVSMAEYETLGSGAVASHLITDLDTIDHFVGATLSKTLVAVLSILGTAVVLLCVHWQLALFILLLNPVVIAFTTALGRRVKRLKRRENSAYEAFQGALTETLDTLQQIRAANRDDYYLGRLLGLAREVRDHATAYAWQSEALGRLSFTVFLCGVEMFRATAMLMVVFSDLSIGLMFAVFGYLWYMMGPVQEVLNIQTAFAGARAALDRVNRLLALQAEPDYPHRCNPFQNRLTTAVELREVGFAYGSGPPVLDGVSLTIAPGEKVALVGASGGGKTTLVQVLLGLYVPQSGSVLFDGVPVTDIGLDVVREHVATVLQHPALFNDTVRANLTLGRERSDARLWQALEVAQLAETVAALPRGLDTVVGRQGVRLSGGQRQRLAVARMVLAEPRVVILDEATSALDTATEGRLHVALNRFLAGRTTLIIAHRLSAVKQADRVYVFDGGRIIEQGRHAELIHGDGLYARLYGGVQA